ncbi:hypothetical protein [Glaciibacter flavus]|uniref:hypothetical protein n=1 Tax=Orlajensenia flava TaxID=2565934 RepID=UPI003AFF62DB
MNPTTAYVPAGSLRAGDVMVNAHGTDFTVTKVTRIRDGRKVFVERPDGAASTFTARFDARTRVTLPRPTLDETDADALHVARATPGR